MRLNISRVDSQTLPTGKVVKLEKVPLPQRSTILSAGYDLFTPVTFDVGIGEQVFVPLGITWRAEPWRLDFPTNHGPSGLTGPVVQLGGLFAKIFDRSGLALKKRFSTLAGVIDQDYLLPWGLVCRNDGSDPIAFKVGDKVAQFVLLPFLVAEDLEGGTSDTTRGGGFGSTG